MNKKSVLAIIAAGLLCAAALTACKDDTQQIPDRTAVNSTIESEPEKAHFTFVEQSQSKPITLMSEDKQTVYAVTNVEKVSFVAENRADRESSKNINDVLGTAYDRARENHTSIEGDLSSILTQESPDHSSFPWGTTVDYTCTRNDGRAISVTEVIEYTEAGVLTGTVRFGYNFNPLTGEQVRNIFYVTGNKESFDSADDLIYRKLVAKYGEEAIDYSNVTSSFIDEALDCWRFTENGVVVTFNAGSIADPAAGVLEVEYSKDELPEFAQKYFIN